MAIPVDVGAVQQAVRGHADVCAGGTVHGRNRLALPGMDEKPAGFPPVKIGLWAIKDQGLIAIDDRNRILIPLIIGENLQIAGAGYDPDDPIALCERDRAFQLFSSRNLERGVHFQL